MSVRNRRFVDRDLNSSPRPTNVPNLIAKQEVPNDFEIIKKVLSEELDASALYKTAWTAAEEQFKTKKENTPQFFTSTTPDECYTALIAYTLHKPSLYEDFNRQFRLLTNAEFWTKFPYKSLFFLLKLAKKETVSEPKIENTIYRAIGHHFPSEPKVGDLFYFDYFASCSTNRAIAESAASLGGTLIEIQNGASKGIGIRNYSIYPEENEVLVFSNNRFKVVEFFKNEPVPRLLLRNIPLRGKRFMDIDFSDPVLAYDVPNPFASLGSFQTGPDIGETSPTPIRRRRYIPQMSYPSETPYDFNTVKKILEEELINDDVYLQTWKMAEKELQIKKHNLPLEYFKDNIPDECYIAVIAYTINTTNLYRKFNRGFKMLTDEESWERFPYKSLYYLLTLAVPGILNNPDPSHDLYRGIRNYHFDPEPVVGSLFHYHYFASHTVDLMMAEFYLKGNGTLVKVPGGARMAIGISKYSMFEQEDEVLVFPKNKFVIKEFKKNDSPGIDVLVLQWTGVVSNF